MSISQTEIKRIYWEEYPDDPSRNGIMVFELVNGRKLELMYDTEEVLQAQSMGEEVVTSIGFRTAV